MNLYLLFIVVLALWKIKIHGKGFHEDFLSRTTTLSVNGIFILIVFYSHFANDYYTVDLAKDGIMHSVKIFLNQLMVTSFLFYSGYGVFRQLEARAGYARKILTNRMPKVWLHYAFAVVLYVAVQLLRGNTYSPVQYILAFVGWQGIGNSDWYIFTILALYLITWFAFTLLDNNPKAAVTMTFVCTGAYMLLMAKYKADYWYNTALCYPFGMLVGLQEEKIRKFLLHNGKYFLSLAGMVALLLVLKQYQKVSFWYYNLYALVFISLVVLVTMKVQFRSPALEFFGRHLFWIYMLHRIPLMLLKGSWFAVSYPYGMAAIALAVTVATAVVLDYVFGKLDKQIWKAGK